MVDLLGRAFARVHVVAGPEPAEPGAGQGELADQLDEAGIVRVGADGRAEPGDHARAGALPVGVEGLFGGIEERVAQPVRPRHEAR